MTEILASASFILQGGDSEPERRNKCSSQKERRMTSPVGPAVGHSHKRVHYEITECLVQGTEQLLVRLGIATSAPMLVVTDDLHPNGNMPRYMVVS
jgi:hypothetical protein